MNKYYFFQTMKIEGRPRLRPLKGQTGPDGNPVHTDWNVQADSIMRGSYPIGTIFGSESLEERTHSTTPFYSAGAIYPLGLLITAYIVPSHRPTQEMEDAYKDYCTKQTLGSQPSTINIFTEEKSPTIDTSAVKKTLKEQLAALYPVPSIEKDSYFIDAMHWSIIVRNIKQKVSTLMIGPSGSGKTELLMLAARKLGLGCSVFDMGSMIDPTAGLLGVHRLKKGGESVFDYAQFALAVQKPGVVVLDELSRAPVTANNILLPCLDSRRTLPVEIAGGDTLRSIPVHPECVFMATANVGAEYTGTLTMDRALTARFFPLELGYLDPINEKELLIKRYDIDGGDAANITAVAATIRSLFFKQDISCCVTTRETLLAASMVKDGFTALEAMQYTFLPIFEGTVNDGERSIVSKIFMTR